MAFVAGKPDPKSGKYRAGFTNRQGRQQRFTGTTNPKETLAIARKLEDDHRQIRLGYRDAPVSSDFAKSRAFAEVCAEYLAWGNSQGGRGGRPWAAKHAEKRAFYLDYWQARLGLKILADLSGILPRAETALRELQQKGRTDLSGKTYLIYGKRCKFRTLGPLSGKSLSNYAEALRAFCLWAKGRGFLEIDPLDGLAGFDCTPKTQRRAMTAEEVHRFFAALDETGTAWAKRRRAGYELALASGLRKGELTALKVADLDVERCGLKLRAEFTKNRKPGFQPLPRFLVDRLAAESAGKGPEAPLVFVAADAAESFQRDLKRAGIPRWAPGGRLDFHSLRVGYVSFVLEAGGSAKEAQSLARHSTPALTMNIYGRARDTRLADLAEAVGQHIKPAEVVALAKTGTDDAPVSQEPISSILSISLPPAALLSNTLEVAKNEFQDYSTIPVENTGKATFTPPLRQWLESQYCKALGQNALEHKTLEVRIPHAPPAFGISQIILVALLAISTASAAEMTADEEAAIIENTGKKDVDIIAYYYGELTIDGQKHRLVPGGWCGGFMLNIGDIWVQTLDLKEYISNAGKHEIQYSAEEVKSHVLTIDVKPAGNE